MGKLFYKCHSWRSKRLKKINNNFGRIKELRIFALPNKKGVKKQFLR
jgi:hypothetical protein